MPKKAESRKAPEEIKKTGAVRAATNVASEKEKDDEKEEDEDENEDEIESEDGEGNDEE